MKNARKKEFEQEDLRERLREHLKEKALQPYLFARQAAISQATVYRLLSRMNVSIKNQEKIERAIQFCEAVEFCEEVKLEKPVCGACDGTKLFMNAKCPICNGTGLKPQAEIK